VSSAASGKPGRTDPVWRGRGRANGASVQRREFRYGSGEFRAASDWARRLPSPAPASVLIGSVARHPAMLRVLAAVWRLPVTDLQVLQADADAW
jgi:hypothetical protein